ncbi:MAG: HAMP domain-containing protein, partial [Clostridia bacterium]|nr:HAMP domain-containing protein [Clostridia bacterium]
MRKIRFRTIFSRMMFMQCLTVALAVLLVGAVLTIVVHAQKVGEYGTQLNRYAQIVRELLSGNTSDADTRIKQIAQDGDLLIEQIGAHGEVKAYYTDARWKAYAEQSLKDTAYARVAAHANEVGDSLRHYFAKGAFPVLTCYCAVGEPTDSGLLLVNGDLTQIRRSTLELILWTVLISVLALIASGIVTYYTSYRVINPFVEMNHAVQCYSRGDFSTRIPVDGKDEAAQLGRSLNEMAEQLRGLEDTRRSFVANVSHELRSPLTSMKG